MPKGFWQIFREILGIYTKKVPNYKEKRGKIDEHILAGSGGLAGLGRGTGQNGGGI